MSDPASNTAALVPTGGGGFSTSGQISWTDLANTAFNTTVGVLSRLSAAGVDPYTVVVAQQLGSQFALTATGRRQIEEALSKLHSYRLLGTALSVGFGVNHLVRIMGRTEEGQLCLALCASLSEMYDIGVASEIILEMTNTSRAPASLRPSILQWKALLESCSGILSTSTFAVLAERYMNLYSICQRLPWDSFMVFKAEHGISSPESIANALLAIGKVTRGELISITIIGRVDAGWLAAFAEWHFQLSVQIVHAETGNILHDSRIKNDYVQLLIIYENEDSRVIAHLQTIGKTYRLANATTLFTEYGSEGASVSGRVDWKHALFSAFGSEFKELLSHQQSFGSALGNIAQILKAIDLAEEIVTLGVRRSFAHYEGDSYGRGFLTNLIRWLPELTPLTYTMEEAFKQDVTLAIEQYEANVTALKIACDCEICRQDMPEYNRLECPPEKYCLVLILEVIVAVGRTMSIVNLPVVLDPARLGFESLYARQLTMRNEIQSDLNIYLGHKELGSAYFATASTEFGLYDALSLFTGRIAKLPQDLDRYSTCAVSTHGVCVYFQDLEKASNGQLTGQVTVVPGQIEFNEKSYSLMTDMLISPVSSESDAICWTSSLTFNDVSVIVKETTVSLQISLEVRQSDHKDALIRGVPPAMAINTYLRQKRLVVCEGRGCTKIEQQAVIKDERAGYRVYDFGEKKIEVLEVSKLQLWILCHSGKQVIIRDKECLDCCLRTVLDMCYSTTIGMIIRCVDD